MGPGMIADFCTVLIFDRSTSAVAVAGEVFQPGQAAKAVLGREPDSTANGLISWGAVQPAEIRRLMLSGDDPDTDGADQITAWEEIYAGDGFLWSLFARSAGVEQR